MCVLGSHYYVYYDKRKNKVLLRTHIIETFLFSPFPVFVGNGYVQHAGVEYHGHQNLRYCAYFVADDINSPDKIENSFSGGIPIRH